MEDAGDSPVIDMQTVMNRIAEFVGDRPVQLNGRAIRLAVETQPSVLHLRNLNNEIRHHVE